MKREALLSHLVRHGCRLEREGSSHSIWSNPSGEIQAIPRHKEINRFIRRLESGNFGSAKMLGAGLSELRLDFGPGYRVYFGRDGKTLIILVGVGSKRRQQADIAAAMARWQRYRQAKKEQ